MLLAEVAEAAVVVAAIGHLSEKTDGRPVTVIEIVGPGEESGLLPRKLVVEADSHEIIVRWCPLRARDPDGPIPQVFHDRIALTGRGPEFQVRSDQRGDLNRSTTGQNALTSRDGGNPGDIRGREAFSGPFVTSEKERLVPENRSAERTAELVALEFRFRVSGRIVEKVRRVEVVIAEEFKDRAVKGIGPGFRDRADNGSGLAAVFGGIIVGDDLEFFDGFRAGIGSGGPLGVARKVGVAHPVQEVNVLTASSARDAQRIAHAAEDGLFSGPRDFQHAWLEEAQLGQVAVIERQVFHLLLRHQVGHCGAAGFDQGRFARDRHLLRYLADLQRMVHHRRLSYGHRDPFSDAGLEPG